MNFLALLPKIFGNPISIGIMGIGLVISHIYVFNLGARVQRGEYLTAQMKEVSESERVRVTIRNEGQRISATLEATLRGARLQDKVINRYITREKEIYHVLTNPDCAYPPSTIRVLNDARRGTDPDRSAPSKPAGGGGPSTPAAGGPPNVDG